MVFLPAKYLNFLLPPTSTAIIPQPSFSGLHLSDPRHSPISRSRLPCSEDIAPPSPSSSCLGSPSSFQPKLLPPGEFHPPTILEKSIPIPSLVPPALGFLTALPHPSHTLFTTSHPSGPPARNYPHSSSSLPSSRPTPSPTVADRSSRPPIPYLPPRASRAIKQALSDSTRLTTTSHHGSGAGRGLPPVLSPLFEWWRRLVQERGHSRD